MEYHDAPTNPTLSYASQYRRGLASTLTCRWSSFQRTIAQLHDPCSQRKHNDPQTATVWSWSDNSAQSKCKYL